MKECETSFLELSTWLSMDVARGRGSAAAISLLATLEAKLVQRSQRLESNSNITRHRDCTLAATDRPKVANQHVPVNVNQRVLH